MVLTNTFEIWMWSCSEVIDVGEDIKVYLAKFAWTTRPWSNKNVTMAQEAYMFSNFCDCCPDERI